MPLHSKAVMCTAKNLKLANFQTCKLKQRNPLHLQLPHRPLFRNSYGTWTSKRFPNAIGVPQGFVISPMLFNVVMAKLDRDLSTISETRYAIFTDDAAILTHRRQHLHTQLAALREAITGINMFSRGSKVKLSAEETSYVVKASRKPHEENTYATFPLIYRNVSIQRSIHVKALGVSFQANGKAGI